MLYRSTVGPKGQITIPKDLRELLHLLEGEEVSIFCEEDTIVVKHTNSSLHGRLRGAIDVAGIDRDVVKFRREWLV